jgi:hypothetical protein
MRSSTLQLRLALPADRKSAPVEKYVPGQQVEDLKARFYKLNAFIMARGGFVTSVPGASEVVFECLPDSSLPDELRAMGHNVMPADPPMGERILPHAIVEQLTRTSSGALVPIRPGSTVPVAETRTHAGICKVLRYQFSIRYGGNVARS